MDDVRTRTSSRGLIAAGLAATTMTVLWMVTSSNRPSADFVRSAEALALDNAHTMTRPTAAADSRRPEPTASPEPLSEAEQVAIAGSVERAVHSVSPGTDVGLAVYDRLSGTYVARVNADQGFYTASVVKLLLATDILREAGWRVPGGEQRAELLAMLRQSADWVAASVWADGGGPVMIPRTAELMGLSGTSPPAVWDQWEMTSMAPLDVVRTYEYLLERMPGPASAFVLDGLRTATALGADGFDQTFGLPKALPGTTRAIKQGWMEIDSGFVLNSTGLVGDGDRYVVALMTLQPHDAGFDRGREAVTAGASALEESLSRELAE